MLSRRFPGIGVGHPFPNLGQPLMGTLVKNVLPLFHGYCKQTMCFSQSTNRIGHELCQRMCMFIKRGDSKWPYIKSLRPLLHIRHLRPDKHEVNTVAWISLVGHLLISMLVSLRYSKASEIPL